jgi:class 3 adenylate cyclase
MTLLSADVQGYSTLMSDNEEATIRTLTTYRAVMTHHIRQHRGRVVDTTGDNLLAAFGSVTHAVQSAVAMQQTIRAHNADLPAHRVMAFRMGINLGDVIRQGKRLYGNSLNIAARLEGLAEAGGIHISGAVYDQVAARLKLPYVYLGEQVLKNIAQPVRVYRIDMPAATRSLTVYTGGGTGLGPRRLSAGAPRHIGSGVGGLLGLLQKLAVASQDVLRRLDTWRLREGGFTWRPPTGVCSRSAPLPPRRRVLPMQSSAPP